MTDKDDVRASLLASARRELQAHRSEQRALAENHLAAKLRLDRVQSELVEIQQLQDTVRTDRLTLEKLLLEGEMSLKQLAHLPTAGELGVHLGTAEEQMGRDSAMEAAAAEEITELRNESAVVHARLTDQQERFTLLEREKDTLCSARLEAVHQSALLSMLTEEVTQLSREEDTLQHTISTMEERRAALLRSGEDSSSSRILEGGVARCTESEDIPLQVSGRDALTALQDAVSKSRQRVEWLKLFVPREVSLEAHRVELERVCNEVRTANNRKLVLEQIVDTQREVDLLTSVCRSTSCLAEESEKRLAMLPTIESLTSTVNARQEQVERLTAEVSRATEDLNMLEDRKAADRCNELSHAINSYVAVTIPGAMDALRSKREELHELRIGHEQWPSESSRHVSYIATLTKERDLLEVKATSLDAQRRHAVAARLERDNLRRLWEARRAEITDNAYEHAPSGTEDEENAIDCGAAILEGDRLRYVPLPPAANVTFISDSDVARLADGSGSSTNRRKAHFNFFAVTLMNKLQQLVGATAGRYRLISLNM